nr:hypothetical protein [uncultured Flavobacterium sp.]
MKLSTEHVKQVDQRLIAFGFSFIDMRLEVLDHILCLIENKENLDFQQAVDVVFEEQKDYLKTQKLMQWTNVTAQRVSFMKDIFLNPVFILLWILSFFVYYNLPYSDHNLLLEDLDIIPIISPNLSFVILAIYSFTSKNKVASTYGALFTISILLMFYLYFGIHWVRRIDEFPSLVILSGFTAIGLMMYYLIFYYKVKNEKKFKNLLNS